MSNCVQRLKIKFLCTISEVPFYVSKNTLFLDIKNTIVTVLAKLIISALLTS